MDTNINIPKKEIAPGVFSTGGTATMPTVNPINNQSNVITPESLAPVTPIQGLPTTPAPTAPPKQTPINYDEMFGLTDFQKQAEQTQEQGISEIIKSMGVLQNEATDLQAERQRRGIEDLYKQGQATKARITALDAEMQQDDIVLAQKMRNEERRDTLLPFAQMGQAKLAGDAAIYRGLKTAEKNTLISQQLAQQGDIALAEQFAKDAIDAKYAPYKQNIENYKTLLEIIKPSLTAAENKRLKAQEAKVTSAENEIKKAEENEKAIQNIALKIAEFGGDPNIIKNAKTPIEAISMAGNKLQDPVQKLQLQKLRNDIAKQEQEAKILKQYGGLTPEQWAKKQEEALKGLDATKRTAKDLENQKTQVETILNSTAINSVVGPTAISRSRGGRLSRTLLGAGAGAIAGTPFGLVGAIPGAVVGGIAGATLPGVSDEVSGRADDLVALTEQMLSQQFLDKLIQVKGQGATFGALTDREGNSLRSAANAISQTAIRDKNDKVIGYDMSENEFKRQFGIMQDAITLAEIENTGKVINDSEDADLETLWQSGGALVAPGNYYQ